MQVGIGELCTHPDLVKRIDDLAPSGDRRELRLRKGRAGITVKS